MKALKTISTIALAALVLAGCQQKELEFTPSSPIKIGEEITIIATGEVQPTKTVLQADNSIYWGIEDKIDVFYGANRGIFTSQNTAAAATAEFTGTLSAVLGTSEGSTAPTKYVYGVYPAATTNAVDADGKVTVTLPLAQVASAGTFDPKAFPTVARSESLSLAFYNVAGALAITVGEDNVNEIELRLNDNTTGAALAGDATVTIGSDNKPTVSSVSNISDTIVLTPADGTTFTNGETYVMAVLPGTYAGGITFTLKHTTGDDTVLTKTDDVTVERSKVYPMTLKAKEKVLTVERVWGKFPTEWPSFTNNLDRCATTDGEYVYVAKAGAGQKGIWAISIEDPSQVKEVCMDGVEDEGTFYTSCVRTIYNPSTGKYILLLSNLSLTGGEHLYLYAYVNGIDSAPIKLLSDYTLPTWAERRFGDFFTVVGNWQKGYVWFRTNTSGASTTARFTINNGALTSQTPDGFNYGYAASQGKGSFYQYDMSATFGLLVTDSIGMFYDLNSAEGQEWNSPATTENMRRMFGITPFTFAGKKYIAYTKMKDDNAARSWLRIITDQGNASAFKASLEANDIVYQAAIQINEEGQSTNVMTGATYSDQTSASCAVAELNDCVYIIGHHHNVGLSVFKMYMK